MHPAYTRVLLLYYYPLRVKEEERIAEEKRKEEERLAQEKRKEEEAKLQEIFSKYNASNQFQKDLK